MTLNVVFLIQVVQVGLILSDHAFVGLACRLTGWCLENDAVGGRGIDTMTTHTIRRHILVVVV